MAKKWTAALLAVVMILTSFPFVSMASGSSESTKPTDGKTENRPFVSGNPSENYRIPGMVTLDDGTIVAVADARWNAQQDGGGNDVITARSTDNGNTWEYTMAGYYGDNGNAFNKSSTGYCDSNITTDGKNVYLLSTFFASGVAINTNSGNDKPESGSGLNSNGQLLLRKSSESSYNYHVGDFSNGYAPVLDSSNNATGYQVNGEYELYQNGSRVGCVWYSDCAFQALKTQYLFFRKSTDGGKTWSGITLVNVKSSDEMFVGAGPGRGIVTEDGTICLPVYVYGDNLWSSGDYSQASSFIYSKDGGKTWSRTGNFTSTSSVKNSNWSSESQLVDLGNGTIRCFYRNGKQAIMYCDATWNGSSYSWGSVVNTGIAIYGNCQLSAIMYPYKVNGKRAILVSSPSDTSGRTTGAIFALLLNNDNTITEYTKKVITSSGAAFQYSCLTVLSDGRVADLYEAGGNDMVYQTFSVANLTGGTVDLPTTQDIQLNVGNSVTLDFDTDYTTSDTDNTYLEQTAKKQLSGATVKKATGDSYSGDEVSAKQALYTFKNVSDDVYKVYHAGMYLSVGTSSKAGYPGASTPANVTLVAVEGGGFQLKQDGHYGLYFDTSANHFERWDFTGKGKDDQDEATVLAHTTFQLYRRVRDGETGSTELPGYICVNTVDDGEEYLIVYKSGDSYFLLNPSTSTTNPYAHCLKATGNSITDGYAVTFLGKKETTNPVVVKDTLNIYNVTVSNDVREVTGAVKYDPVIYTHGTMTDSGFDIGYMMLGNVIADGTVEGEKKTEYTVTDGYSIVSIKCTSVSGADITASSATGSGMLKGSLPSDDITADIASGQTVTLETVVQDSKGVRWTQYDKLYVASNPVAGHLYGCSEGYVTKWFKTYVCSLPFIMVANGSYGNTSVSKVYNERWDHNAKNLYTGDALTFNDESAESDRLVTMYTSGAQKNAGHGQYGKKDGHYDLKMESTTPILAYYYFDTSSQNNQGITNLGNGNFQVQFSYVPVKETASKAGDNSGVEVTMSSSVSSDADLTAENALANYNMNSGTTQTVTVKGNAAGKSTITGYFRVQGTTTYERVCTIAVNLPYQINVCDKSTVRTPYDEATSKVRKSTDYTTSTWNAYRDAMLDAEAYLNDYTETGAYTPSTGVDSIVGDSGSYESLTKRVDFSELDQALADNKESYDSGFEATVVGDQNTYTVDSYVKFEDAYKNGKALSDSVATDDRSDTAGYTVGPDSSTKELQQQVDEATDAIEQGLVTAADASAYESARSLSATVDRTAYPDSGTAITSTVTNGNSTIYKAYNGKDYVNVPATEQATVDGYTTDLLTQMNVDKDSQSGRTFTVTCTVDGKAFATKEEKTKYYYGTVAHIDLSAYSAKDTVCLVQSGTGLDVTETQVDLEDCNYQLALLVQQDITVTVTTTAEPNVVVMDYFGTILGSFTGATSVTVSGKTVTVDGTEVVMKESPKYTFTGWTKADGIYTVPDGQVMKIVQKGNRNPGVATYTIGAGTASDALINNATTLDTTGLETPMELTSANGEFWTRTVNGVEMLASYEQNFTLFSCGVDTQFHAYASSSDLPSQLQNQAMSGIPVTYGVGYFANDKFTLSCDFSAGSQVTVLEVGAIYSASKSGEDELVKGADGTTTVVSRNIGHWTDNENSGTYTMTKKNSSTGTHYMRSYVSYRVERQGTQVPFVVYGDVYQCVDGTVTAVKD